MNFIHNSQQTTARITGIGYLISFLIPVLSMAFIFSNINTNTESIKYVIQNNLIYRYGILSDLVMIMNSIVLSMSLYMILK